ncbi:MAG: YbaN family protein [Bdellovibrionales bacterium]|nr:YbaN family protein [Bdellovibrionales bacterium]
MLLRRSLYVILGFFSIILGIIGLLLPLVPTTPFLLLAAWFFSNSSEKLHYLLLQSPVVGKVIQEWEQGGFITMKTKWIASTMIVGLMSYPLLFLVFPRTLKFIALSSACCVLLFIWRCPSREMDSQGR